MKAVRLPAETLRPHGETLQFMQRMWALTHALEVRSKSMGKTLGVTGPQRLVIRIIGQMPSASAGDISKTLGMHPSTLTGILARLEAHTMIVRTTDPVDRRVARLQLTANGRRIDRERKGTVEAAVRRAMGRADASLIASTMTMLELLTSELDRS